MKIIIARQVVRGPVGTTSLTLRDRLISYLRFWLTKSGMDQGMASLVTSTFSGKLFPLFHGKLHSRDPKENLRDLTDEERSLVIRRARTVLERLPNKLPDNVLSKIDSFMEIIDDYAKGETQKQDPNTKEKMIDPKITLMMILSDLVDNSDDVSIKLVPVDPKEIVKTKDGPKPVGPGVYEMVATTVKDGKSEEKSLLDLVLLNRDPKETEKSINNSLLRLKSVKNTEREEGLGQWLRILREDPVGIPEEKTIPEQKYQNYFSTGNKVISEAVNKIGKLREGISQTISRFPPVNFSVPLNLIFDIVSELEQSAEAMARAAGGKETIDLSQFEISKAADLILPAEAKTVYQNLLEIKEVLVGLLNSLKELVAPVPEKPNTTPKSLVPEDDVGSERERRLLNWEIALASGIANRGIRSVEEVIGDQTFWSQFLETSRIPPKKQA